MSERATTSVTVVGVVLLASMWVNASASAQIAGADHRHPVWSASAVGQVQQRYAGVVDQILAAWKHADVVCLGEDHDRFFDNELRITLIRHPAFPATVRAVVVEIANPVHQDLLDRFILDVAPLSRDELSPVWRDATNSEVWESPIYEALLRAIRDVNLHLPRDRRVRVIAGDSEVDWASINRPEELLPLMNRGGNIRELIATQVLDPHLKALAVYGAGHCSKIGMGFPGELEPRYGKERLWGISSLITAAATAKGRVVRTRRRAGVPPPSRLAVGSNTG